MQVDPMDISVLVFAWHCEAEAMCEFKHDEFVKGMVSLGVDTVEKLRGKVSHMQAELRDDQKFRVRFLPRPLPQQGNQQTFVKEHR